MKKIILNTVIFLGFLLGTTACDNFLDKEPISGLTDEMLGVNPDATTDSIKYNSASLAESLLSTAYLSFQSEYYQLDQYIINDGQSDNCYAGEPKAQTAQIDQFTVDATNGIVSRDWSYMFSQISRTNSIIQWIPLNTDKSLTEKRKNEIVGEASFIRAAAYFNLVRLFGNVPLLLREVPAISNANLEEVYPMLYPVRQPADSVYAQIIKDLTVSIKYCKDFSANKFVITKPLSHALLAEVYATKGAPNKVNWEKVKEHSSSVTGDANYDLMPAFDDLFAAAADASGNKNEHCKESLFEVDCNSWSTIGNWGVQMFLGTDWKKFNTPSLDLVKAFTTQNETKRYQASIVYGDVTGKWSDQFWPSNKYPFCNKMRVNEKGNIILWRLASVILLNAEAENELGNLESARKLINRVRNRAGMPDVIASSKDQMRLAIENERRLELAFEGYRWFDLVRTGRAISVMQVCSDHQKNYGAHLTEEKTLWPIPQNELDQNDLLTQNSGY